MCWLCRHCQVVSFRTVVSASSLLSVLVCYVLKCVLVLVSVMLERYHRCDVWVLYWMNQELLVHWVSSLHISKDCTVWRIHKQYFFDFFENHVSKYFMSEEFQSTFRKYPLLNFLIQISNYPCLTWNIGWYITGLSLNTFLRVSIGTSLDASLDT